MQKYLAIEIAATQTMSAYADCLKTRVGGFSLYSLRLRRCRQFATLGCTRSDFSGHVEKSTLDLTSPSPSGAREGGEFKASQEQERGLERDFPDPLKSQKPDGINYRLDKA